MSNGCINTDWQGTWLPCSQKFPQNDDQSWAVQNEFMLAKIQISGLFAYWQPDVKVEYTVILEIHNERSCRLKKKKKREALYQRKHDFKITYSAREFFNKDMNNTFHLAAIGDLRWSMHQSLRRAILQMMEFYKNKIFKYKKILKKK